MRLTFDKRARDCLFSRMQLEAKLLTRIVSVKKELGSYPGLTLVREGTSLLYEIKCEEKDEHFYSLELDREHISLTIYSMQDPVFFLQEATLRMLGILQLLSHVYEVKMNSFYPYLVMILASQQLNRFSQKAIKKEDTAPELVLTRKLISLMRENTRMKEEHYKMLGKFRKVLLEAIAASAGGKESVEEIALSLHLDKEDVLAALDRARESGYRVVRTGNAGLNLVRI